jgi:hypothetical protein
MASRGHCYKDGKGGQCPIEYVHYQYATLTKKDKPELKTQYDTVTQIC